ncbi:choice-of-anchor J domain-containing protein [bacterium]|nr:choice-of-anchor J domain-containing protein [bacterium]
MRSITMLLVVCVIAGMVFGIGIGQSKNASGIQIRTSLNNRPATHSTKNVTVWSLDEDFDSSTELPTGWTTVDGDGDGQPWYIYSYNTHSGDNCAGSMYNASGNDDWLITPQVHIDAGDTFYCWYASQDPSYCDEHIQILVSTGTADVSSFTDTIYDYTTPDTVWRQFVYSLDTYAGQDIYVAFHNISVDMFVLKVDDVAIGQRPAYDGAVESIDTLSPYLDPGGDVTPAATVTNFGSGAISPDVICYVIHNGDTVNTETIAVTDIASGTSQDVVFSPYTLALYDAVYEIAFAISDTSDEVEDNNTSSYYVYTYTTARTVILQEFTATWCTWCSYPAVALHQLKDELGDSICIGSYHVWGETSDPYWIGDEGDDLASGYGITGIPSTACNGSFYIVGGSTGDLTNEYALYSSIYNAVLETKTPMTLDFTISSATATDFDVSTTIEILGELKDGLDLRIHYIITETDIAYHWEGAFPLDSLFDVVRAILPDYAGVAVSGTTFTDDKHFTIDPSWNADKCYLTAFIQDGTNGEIFYAKETKILPDGIAEKNNLPGKLALDCNPNPFNSSTEIKVNVPESGKIKLAIYDLKGRSIKTIDSGEFESGTHNFRWDGDDNSGNTVSTGIYFVKLDTGKSTLIRKIALIK